jgi:putative transposase
MLQEQAPGIFDTVRGPKPADLFSSPERLYSEIGRLKMELDWIKKSQGSAYKSSQRLGRSQEHLATEQTMRTGGVTRSTIDAKPLAAEPDEQELTLLREIDAAYTRHPFYGSSKMTE